ncbi:MAG TPA: chemotaxis protein CheB [Verrucomicrobiae bacterium]|nr:chemotaxis protein CheB [Verrucomicrobiae bacterium]
MNSARGATQKVAKPNQKSSRPAPPPEPSKADSFPIVGIGASAGGLEAFKELLTSLPERTGMAYVLVPHLDPDHQSVLTEILSRFTKIHIAEVIDGMPLERDRIYVIPPNKTMGIAGGKFVLVERQASHGPHLPIDYFLTALANDRGDRAIGIILSGTASDGTRGCIAVKVAGGITFAQDEKSAKYNDMPGNAIRGGSIDFVLPPKDIARGLARISRRILAGGIPAESLDPEVTGPPADLDALFALLQKAMGVDFRHYKQTTLQRRIKRRMVLHHILKLKDYLRYIESSPTELDALYRDLLIHVTEFFREVGAFETLYHKILPSILQDRKPEDGPLRVWIPGCSTGQEVYSLAMIFLEFLWGYDKKRKSPTIPQMSVQIFATDISDFALDRARSGVYAANEISGISKERLARFFVRHDGGYQIHKSVREMCVFAKQNVVKDPPFSNLDLISCRNLLIYFGPILQKRVIPTFYYALKPRGYLMLGPSESLGSFEDLFTLIDKKHKIYQKKRSTARVVAHFMGPEYAVPRLEPIHSPKTLDTGFDVDREVERILAHRFVPGSIVVNQDMEIVQFRGKVGPYLEPATGHPTFSLSKMAREDLQVDLRDALTRAKKENRPVRKEGLRIAANGGTREIDLEVIPIRGQSAAERLYIIAFQDAVRPVSATAAGSRRLEKQTEKGRASHELARTNQEVARLRDQLHTLIDEHETTLEEFKSANAEILSANEELQSTNEELETTKEELQSSNEELSTLNEELQNSNAELTLSNNDQLNLMTNVNLPVVMVGNDLRIRRFTPPAEKLLNLLPGDVGRRLGEIRSNIEPDELEQVARTTIENAVFQEREVRVKDGPWYLLRVRPYKTWEDKIEGAVISFLDIDSLKRTLDQTRTFAEALIENARESILVLDEGLRVTLANPVFYRTFQVSPEETRGRLIYELGNHQWDIPKLRELFHEITARNTRIDGFEVRRKFQHLGLRHMILNARRIEPQGGTQMILLSIEDVTRKK